MDREGVKEAAEKLTPSELRRLVLWSAVIVVALFALPMFGCPMYHVWEQHMKGEAELARAESNRKVKVAEARAAKESAKLYAEADTIRAWGEARANMVMGPSLAGETGERRLRYLWIQHMEQGAGREVHYIPTEAGMPLIVAPKASAQLETTR